MAKDINFLNKDSVYLRKTSIFASENKVTGD